MRRIVLIGLILSLLVARVSAMDIQQAQAEQFGTEKIERGLSDRALLLMEGVAPDKPMNVLEKLRHIFMQAVKESKPALHQAVKTVLEIILIAVFCQLLDSVSEEKNSMNITVFGAVSVVACTVSDIRGMVSLGSSTVKQISDFINLLLPVMVSSSVSSGSMTAAGTVYTLTSAAFSILVRFCSAILVPVIYAYIALACADCALQQERLKRMRDILGWTVEKALKGVVYLFIGMLTVTGAVSGTLDSLTLKATKMAISGAVPVVGSIISGAAETVLNSAAFLKTTVGTYGMVAVIAIFLFPFLSIGISFLFFKIGSAIAGILESRLVVIMDAVSKALGYLLAMTGSCALIAILSCCGFLKMVHT